MEKIKRLEEELESKTEVKNQTVKIAQQMQQRTEDHDKEIMETRFTVVAYNLKETAKKGKAQNRKRKNHREMI